MKDYSVVEPTKYRIQIPTLYLTHPHDIEFIDVQVKRSTDRKGHLYYINNC